MKRGRRSSAGHGTHGEGCAIDRPEVEAVFGCVAFFEGHVDRLVWRSRGRASVAESCIVPLERWRSDPLRWACSARVFHDDAHAVAPVVMIEVTKHPDAPVIHLYDCRNSLSRPEPKHGHFHWIWNRIAIERDHLEGMARQSEAANFRGTAIQNMKKDAFSRFHEDRVALPQHSPVDGE